MKLTETLDGRIPIHFMEISNKILNTYIRLIEEFAEYYWKPSKLWCSNIEAVICISLNYKCPKVFINTVDSIGAAFHMKDMDDEKYVGLHCYKWKIVIDGKNIARNISFMYRNSTEMMMKDCGCKKECFVPENVEFVRESCRNSSGHIP